MPASQQHISDDTQMGANLVADGAAFRVWAPGARGVWACGDFNGWSRDEDSLLVRGDDGRWSGFFPGVEDGATYKFFVAGEGSEGFKRDPYARELSVEWPNPRCVVRAADAYPWQDGDWRPPAFHDLVIYQLHVGTFTGPDRGNRVAKFLDVLDRVEYLADLGINAVEPLPVVEYSSPRSMGYNGADLFSPEMDYQVREEELGDYLPRVNRLLTLKGRRPLERAQLAVPIHQLKVMIDIFHAWGIAVLLDVVYNHASGDLRGGEQDESIYFFDRRPRGDDADSLYFSREEHTGPVFDFAKPEVRQFLIDNARFFVEEYHVDGLRYDQVTVIDRQSQGRGWSFCQDLTSAVRWADPSSLHVAEYWPTEPAVVQPAARGGAGFDAAWHDGLRRGLRGVLAQAAGGREASLRWREVVEQLRAPGFPDAWRAVQCLESHDEVYHDRHPRIAALAGGGDPRSGYARSRSRAALGLLLTAPGIPMLFMGQELLAGRRWGDHPEHHPGSLIDWGTLANEKSVGDFRRFTRELIALRRRHPALRGEGVAVVTADDYHRVLAFQRWIPGIGRDVVAVVSLGEHPLHGYPIPFPRGGDWLEVFNSDVYEGWVNPSVVGNGGRVRADGPPRHGLAASAAVVVPANSLVVFASDAGD